MEKPISKITTNTIYLTIIILFINLLTTTIFQIINIKFPLRWIYLIVIIISCTLFLYNNKDNWRCKIFTLIFVLFLLLALPLIYQYTYDFSIDGNSYHKPAIAFLKEGWNPIYQNSSSFAKANDYLPGGYNIWVDHYPKATWNLAAIMYDFFGSIESGKSLILIFSICLSLYIYNLLSLKIGWKKSLIISIISFLNPIILCQMFTYYVDGIMGILIAFEILLLMKIKDKMEFKKSKMEYILLLSVICILANLKFTGLLYSGCIAAIFYFRYLIINRNRNLFSKFKELTIIFTAIFAIAIGIIGSSSYIKNTIDHHNPLYPLVGKDKVDIITTMQPKSFGKLNTLQKFGRSLFSKTANVTYNDSLGPQLKIPFTFSKKEKEAYALPDTRIGGFGIMFSGLLLISLVIIIINFIKKGKNIESIFIVLLCLLLPLPLVGEIWWARYVPQLFYIIPLSCYILSYQKSIISKFILAIVFIVVNINIYPFFKVYSDNFKEFRRTTSEFRSLSKKSKKNNFLEYQDKNLLGVQFNVKDFGINYTHLSDKEEDIRYIYSWKIKVKN